VSGRSTFIGQYRKPVGWFGRFTLWRMNRSHSKLTDWGLTHVSVSKGDMLLDVGCGGGATVGKLALKAAEGKVYGVDHSETSVAASKKKNARWIAKGRVEIRQASVSQLPFSANIFDLVTAVETHFWWSNLPEALHEILRVLKPGGRLLIVAEVYKGAPTMASRLAEKHASVTGMTLLSADEHRDLFERAGYEEVEIIEERKKGWICSVGRKPVAMTSTLR
jgi:SAM-dependent methyltransferase